MKSDPPRRPPVLTAPQPAPVVTRPLRAPRTPRGRLTRRQRRLRWGIGASVALHLAILLLFVRLPPSPMPEAAPPPSDVAVVFESAKPASPQAASPAPEAAAPLPSSNVPTRQASEAPAVPPPPPPAPALPAPPPPPPPAAAAPAEAPAIRAPLDRLALLPPPLPVPLPSAPPEPAEPRPASRPQPRVEAFPKPMAQNWFFPPSGGSPATASRRAALAVGPSSNQRGDIEGAQQLGPDWGSELKAYVRDHSRYPDQAARNGEQGDSMVLVTVDSEGHVKSVALEQRSGSVWLDAELLSIFRHARLPPFPAGTDQPEVTFHFTMHYILRS